MAFLGFGFLLFGFAIGGAAGLSVAPGTAQTLLTSLFTFVSGALLTFGGFKFKARTEAEIDPRKVGIGLTTFSLGIIVGLGAGIGSRVWWAQGHPATGASSPSGVNLQAKTEKLCTAYRADLREKLLTPDRSREYLDDLCAKP